ncbi:MAG: DUF4381 domain-containing protein [Pseudomonadota bacterium]
MNGSPDTAALLAQLADLASPPAISWWPPAWGWWALCGLLLIAVVWAVRRYRDAVAQRRWRRQAHAELDRIERELDSGVSHVSLVSRVSVLLRRIAILQLGRSTVARVHGRAWLDMLDRLSGSNAFTHGAGRRLVEQPFRADEPAEADVRELIALARALLRRVRRAPNTARVGSATAGALRRG